MNTYRYLVQGDSEVYEIQARSKFEALRALALVFTVDGRLPAGVVRFV